MRLLLDMGLSPATAAALRAAGHDADHVSERGPNTMADERILEIARAENRVVVTFDLDFPRLLALQRTVQASVILFRVESADTARLTAWLTDLLPRYQADLEAGAILVVDGNRERIRNLPIW
jgi:predicted nuclease of predicted toxin-antitoxin system